MTLRYLPSTLALARHSLRRSRGLIVVLAVVLAAFEIVLVVAAGTFQQSGSFSSFLSAMPSFVRQALGESLLVFLSFAGVVCFGYFHPMVLAALAAFTIAIATEPLAEVESRFVDVVLARSLPRAAVVARSVVLVVFLPAAVVSIMLAATLASLRWLAPPDAGVSATLIASLAVNLWVLNECIGGASLAVAAASHRRATAAGIVGVATLSLFFVDYLARIWKPAASIARFSPFHYYDATAMMMGRPLPASHVEVLGIAAIVGFALAFAIFSRRDL